MECSLAALIACFSWANLYIDTHVSVIDATIPIETRETFSVSLENGSAAAGYRTIVSDAADNPYAGVAVGYSVKLGAVSIGAEASHMLSSLSTGKDRGINAISLRVRWHPFR